MKRAIFNLVPEFPPLAWIATLSDSEVVIHHGKYVEVFDDHFIEGVWAEDAQAQGIANSDCVFGSGGQISERGITFVTSIATTDYLYHYVAQPRTLVSNSLPLILRFANDRLDPKCTDYGKINGSIKDGLKKYISRIPTERGFVKRLVHSNLEVTDEGSCIVDKPMPPSFNSYDSYIHYLSTRFHQCVENARSPSRKRRLHIYSTQSKGYDSTAVNAIARNSHIDGAFTVLKGKANDRYATRDVAHQVDDDGTAICNLLAIRPIALDRREFERGVPNELFYWAGMHTTDDLNLCGITQLLEAPALLLTGNFGEVWYGAEMTRPGTINDELVRWDTGGHGLSEVRLQMGFIQMAVPFIGGQRRSDILRISNSDEMSAWRLGVAYDRPIPRRIAEEAGVPREFFGQRKMASVVEFPRPNIPFDGDLKRRYFDFLRLHGVLSEWKSLLLPLIHRWNAFVDYKGPSQNIYAYYADRLVYKLTGRRELKPAWSHLDGSVFCFAVNALVDRPKQASLVGRR